MFNQGKFLGQYRFDKRNLTIMTSDGPTMRKGNHVMTHLQMTPFIMSQDDLKVVSARVIAQDQNDFTDDGL